MSLDYYFCSAEELRQEIRRRGFVAVGGQDELSEDLKNDDESRGSDATATKTVDSAYFKPQTKLRIAYSPGVVPPSLLVGEKITHWTLGTFFPTLQLFFESGLSCTFEGGFRQSATVGLDPSLRFRLTDLTHEENGYVSSSTLPQKANGPVKSIRILEAAIAERTSVAVQPLAVDAPKDRPPSRPRAFVGTETHIVVGLRLEGMQKMGYVWAKVDHPPARNGTTWQDVSVVGLRDDVPAPFFCYPQKRARMGSTVGVVQQESMIRSAKRQKLANDPPRALTRAPAVNGINKPNGPVKTNGLGIFNGINGLSTTNSFSPLNASTTLSSLNGANGLGSTNSFSGLGGSHGFSGLNELNGIFGLSGVNGIHGLNELIRIDTPEPVL